MSRKTISLGDFLTDEEIKLAVEICKTKESINQTLVRRIIQPNMDRINQALGQENDPNYLAYVVEFICTDGRKTIC